jgi:hypothetical protein
MLFGVRAVFKRKIRRENQKLLKLDLPGEQGYALATTR